jgi:hypothetical protein
MSKPTRASAGACRAAILGAGLASWACWGRLGGVSHGFREEKSSPLLLRVCIDESFGGPDPRNQAQAGTRGVPCHRKTHKAKAPRQSPSSFLRVLARSHSPMRTSLVRGFESAIGAYSWRRSSTNARVGWLNMPAAGLEPGLRLPGGVGPPCGVIPGVCGRTGVLRIGPCPWDRRRCEAPARRLLTPLLMAPADP